MPVLKQKLQATLCQGAVYYMPTRVGSPNYHYCIVMNESAATDTIVLLEIISSKVEKTKRRVLLQNHYKSSAVEMGPQLVSFLSMSSVVDCNVCLECSKDLFVQDLRMSRASYAGQLPRDLLNKIIVETLASTGIRPGQKSRIDKKRAALIEKRRGECDRGVAPAGKITITVK